jgi:C-terminal processing protease CtpA/Prc
MKKLTFLFLLFGNFVFAQGTATDTVKVRKDFEKLIANLEKNYVYYNQKDVDLNCLKSYYSNKISSLKNNDDVLLFFEYLLNEFYDSHMHLKSNIKSSYRLYSPIYASNDGTKTLIASYWKDQIETKFNFELINAEIIEFNGVSLNQLIEEFPTHCQNKTNKEIRTWLVNKILAGRYSEPRILTLKTASGKIETLDMDKIKIRKDADYLSYNIIDNVGIIRINNALGDTDTKKAFKNAIKSLSHTKGIILDLRNTVDGGNTNVANPIAGHFTKKKKVFQKYKNAKTQFVDYIKPQKPNYSNSLVVLVGRWTGSVGEGLASGFDGSATGKVIGTEMEKLAGATLDYKFDYFNFNYQFPYIEVLQQNNEPREKFIPKYLVQCNDKAEDEFLIEAFKLIEANKND